MGTHKPHIHHWFGEEYEYLGAGTPSWKLEQKVRPRNPTDAMARLHDKRYRDSSGIFWQGGYRAGADMLTGAPMFGMGLLSGNPTATIAGAGLIMASLARGATLGLVDLPWD